MIEHIFIASFITYAIQYTMRKGEIFGRLGDLLYKILPPVLHNPVFECVVCMGFWYSSLVYWLVWPDRDIIEWLVTSISVVGLNSILSDFTPEQKTEEIAIKYEHDD